MPETTIKHNNTRIISGTVFSMKILRENVESNVDIAFLHIWSRISNIIDIPKKYDIFFKISDFIFSPLCDKFNMFD